MISYTRPAAGLFCLAAIISASLADDVHTVTKTVTVTKTRRHQTTLTSTAIASDAYIIYGDVPEAGYPYPTDVSTTTLTSTGTSYLTSTETTQSRKTIAGTATTTVAPFGFDESPIQDTLPSAAYYYKNGGTDPVQKLKAREADAEGPELVARAKATTTCKTITKTRTKTKTVQKSSTKTTTSTITGTYITWSSESYGIPESEYTSPTYTSTKTVSTTADGAVYLETTVTTTLPGTTTVLSTTTTVYQACATNNFADSIALSDGTHPRIDRIGNSDPRFVEKGPIPDTPTAYDCCVKAIYGGISYIAAAWVFIPDGSACYYFEDSASENCKEGTSQWSKLTAFYGNGNAASGGVYGNGLCGRVNANQYQLNG